MMEKETGTDAKRLKSFVPKAEYERLEKIFHEEIKRKDDMIASLRKDSHLTMGTALKQANRNQDIIDRLNKLIKENQGLKKQIEDLKEELGRSRPGGNVHK